MKRKKKIKNKKIFSNRAGIIKCGGYTKNVSYLKSVFLNLNYIRIKNKTKGIFIIMKKLIFHKKKSILEASYFRKNEVSFIFLFFSAFFNPITLETSARYFFLLFCIFSFCRLFELSY